MACESGYSGTVQEWLVSLKGTDGKSAYALAPENRFEGSETEWLALLKGEKGEKGDPGEDGRGIADMELIHDELIVTYTDGTVDHVGSIGDGSEPDVSYLEFTLLKDGTFGCFHFRRISPQH